MALPWLAVLLTLICCSMTTDHAISDPDPPIKNLRIDPERKRLVWDQHENVSEIGCYVNSKILRKAIEKPYCSLGDLSCEVKNYTVKVIKGQPFSAWIQYPKQGNPLAAADNLTCRVRDVDQLSCSWAVGEEAPADVQYHFYLKHPLKTWPCPKYMQNQQGVNVQCHFDSLSLQPERQTQFRFLVNGTSGGSKIPCRQMTHRLEEIEILAAPNITKKWCNESYSFMEWEVRSLFTEDIKYELEIQKMVKNPPARTGDPASIPGSGRSPGNALQSCCLERLIRMTSVISVQARTSPTKRRWVSIPCGPRNLPSQAQAPYFHQCPDPLRRSFPVHRLGVITYIPSFAATSLGTW
ncbi:interleukin-3 receptor subunit alpha isoform X3 [Bos javanicus]|uniref:interleukin-3 receptor subunit alpha isoform X3 n=1 Tax=Bos javanicus TaxID=9906 RepID=UPI002AA6B384|nr:interleukin-3 receptor subunit alpha isoform X3 [Bos javanicus]